MVEKDVLERRLTILEEYCRDLGDAKETYGWEEFKRDKVVRRYVERTMHLAIEACLDIANHVISYEGYREPLDNKDVFFVLKEEGLYTATLAEKLKKMAQFRNVVVHDYTRIDPEIVFGILNNHLIDILDYSQAVRNKFLD